MHDWKRLIAAGAAIAALGIVAPAGGGPALADPVAGFDPIDSTQGVQSDEDAVAQDLALTAKAKGWTIEQAADDRAAADAVGRVAEQVAARRPEVFVGSAVSPDPGGPPALYIKGRADQLVRTLAADAEVTVTIIENQPFSFAELEDRKMKVHRSLEAQGFKSVSTGFSITERGRIRAGVTRQPGASADAAAIRSRLPDSVRADTTVTVSDAPIVVDEHAFGGMLVRDDGVDECTSGWSVVNGAGTTGVTTAGHCDGINQIVEPGAGTWDLTHQSEHRGVWGDVEWKTSTHIEPAQFYASATDVRNVNAVEARANISVGETVCQYGRFSNSRNCSLEVQGVSQACTNRGVFNDRLVLMNGDVGIPGDSGGGWSFANTAYGSHKGNCADVPGREVFSVADLYDEALGVSVRIA